MSNKIKKLIPEKSGQYWGYKDIHGNLVVPCHYNFAKEFVHGLGVLESADNYKEGAVDINGNIVLQFDYSYIDVETESTIIAKKRYYGVINHGGDEIIPFEYHNLIRIREGYYRDCYWAEIERRAFGIVSKFNKVLVDACVKEIRYNSSGNISTLWRRIDDYNERELNDLGITLI